MKNQGGTKKADENNLLILYPEVSNGSNLYNCWNWFMPYNQSPYVGQLKQIKSEVEKSIRDFGLKDPQVFVMGMSAGAATASGLLACYPNYFSAGALVSGPAYGSAYSILNVKTILSEGPKKSFYRAPCKLNSFSGKLLVVHGAEDDIVHSSHSKKTVETYLKGSAFSVKLNDEKQKGLSFTEKAYS